MLKLRPHSPAFTTPPLFLHRNGICIIIFSARKVRTRKTINLSLTISMSRNGHSRSFRKSNRERLLRTRTNLRALIKPQIIPTLNLAAFPVTYPPLGTNTTRSSNSPKGKTTYNTARVVFLKADKISTPTQL